MYESILKVVTLMKWEYKWTARGLHIKSDKAHDPMHNMPYIITDNTYKHMKGIIIDHDNIL